MLNSLLIIGGSFLYATIMVLGVGVDSHSSYSFDLKDDDDKRKETYNQYRYRFDNSTEYDLDRELKSEGYSEYLGYSRASKIEKLSEIKSRKLF